MTNNDKELIVNFTLGKITKEDFLKKFPVNIENNINYILTLLQDGMKIKNASDIEHALLLAFHFGYSEIFTPTLCDLIVEDWHFQHENIAIMLKKLKSPSSVDCLYKTALTKYQYLDYDDSQALSEKCIWALGSINTDASKNKLMVLASSDNPSIKRAALLQLSL